MWNGGGAVIGAPLTGSGGAAWPTDEFALRVARRVVFGDGCHIVAVDEMVHLQGQNHSFTNSIHRMLAIVAVKNS